MRSFFFVSIAAVTHLLSVSSSQAQERPFPGVTYEVIDGRFHVTKVDLCTPGVSVRATKYDERGQTSGGFAQSVGAQVAVNGGWVGWVSLGNPYDWFVDGLAIGEGEVWPQVTDHAYTGPVAFGDGRAELIASWLEQGPEAWMKQAVSGHPTIVWDGAVPDFQVNPSNTDPLCSQLRARTAIGLSKDKSTLILGVYDDPSYGDGLDCRSLANYMIGAGAYSAVNMDGSKSSVMWLADRGYVNTPAWDASAGNYDPDVLSNHLAVYATGKGAAPHCPRAIRGDIEHAMCEAVQGWAQNRDAANQSIDVQLYFDAPAGTPNVRSEVVRADGSRQDLCSSLGSCNHGFRFAMPEKLRDSRPHTVYAYGIDPNDKSNVQIGQAEFRCADQSLGFKRHIKSTEVFDSWHWQWKDVSTLDDATLSSYRTVDAIFEPLRLVRSSERPTIYAITAGVKRAVASPASFAAWNFSETEVKTIAPAELAAIRSGIDLPEVPFLAKGSGPEVYLLDIDPDKAKIDVQSVDGEKASSGFSSGCDASGASPWWFALLVGLWLTRAPKILVH